MTSGAKVIGSGSWTQNLGEFGPRVRLRLGTLGRGKNSRKIPIGRERARVLVHDGLELSVGGILAQVRSSRPD